MKTTGIRCGLPTVQKDQDLDLVEAITSYELGNMDQTQEIELFQNLVDSGMAWQLQGHYGRRAMQLMDAGLVIPACVWEH